ncbi:Hypothetical predicted protein, partial [Marmota monax]
ATAVVLMCLKQAVVLVAVPDTDLEVSSAPGAAVPWELVTTLASWPPWSLNTGPLAHCTITGALSIRAKHLNADEMTQGVNHSA